MTLFHVRAREPLREMPGEYPNLSSLASDMKYREGRGPRYRNLRMSLTPGFPSLASLKRCSRGMTGKASAQPPESLTFQPFQP